MGCWRSNAVGIHGFDGLSIIEFNKPAKFWDGTETLSYSHRLNVSYHPRFRFQNDLRALGPTLVMIGAKDEAIDPEVLRSIFAADAPKAQMMVVPASIISASSTRPRRGTRWQPGFAPCRRPPRGSCRSGFDNGAADRSIRAKLPSRAFAHQQRR